MNNEYELELYIYIYTSATPRTPEISLKFEGTPTRPPCASPRTGDLVEHWLEQQILHAPIVKQPTLVHLLV